MIQAILQYFIKLPVINLPVKMDQPISEFCHVSELLGEAIL